MDFLSILNVPFSVLQIFLKAFQENPVIIILSILGGLIPAFLWLSFWLQEDKKNPEPRKRVLSVFIGGMSCTLIALPLEYMAKEIFADSLGLFFAWAAIEETLKFLACYFIAIKTQDDDEPIDAVIYMIITALGFAALENSLYIFTPLLADKNIEAFLTGNLRFMGATLLHVLSSSLVGIFIAYSFFKNPLHKKINIIFGLFFATISHTLFNIFISVADNTTDPSASVLLIFFIVWWGIIALIVALEKVKLITPPASEINSPPS